MNMFKTNAVSTLMQGLIDKVIAPLDGIRVFKPKKVYKPMATSSQDDIDLHKSKVDTRQVKRAKARNDKKLGK